MIKIKVLPLPGKTVFILRRGPDATFMLDSLNMFQATISQCIRKYLSVLVITSYGLVTPYVLVNVVLVYCLQRLGECMAVHGELKE